MQFTKLCSYGPNVDYLRDSHLLKFWDIVRDEGDRSDSMGERYALTGINLVAQEVQPGNTIVIRFDHNGHKTLEAVCHLENLICHSSN